MKVALLVECKLMVEVEVDFDNPDVIEFSIEENSCPGTGIVGAKIDEVMEKAAKGRVCWACNLRGQNRIVSINGQPLRERPRE